MDGSSIPHLKITSVGFGEVLRLSPGNLLRIVHKHGVSISDQSYRALSLGSHACPVEIHKEINFNGSRYTVPCGMLGANSDKGLGARAMAKLVHFCKDHVSSALRLL